MNFQRLLLGIQRFWAERGCVLQQPYDIEVGAGTMHPDTFLRVLGPEPWKVAYCQPSRRPGDGRYGENPMRVYKHFQFQVIVTIGAMVALPLSTSRSGGAPGIGSRPSPQTVTKPRVRSIGWAEPARSP